ncbi:MAG: M48 family metallopeptidase [Pseudomonadales bacterium]|nr:M48 family metallopeptidase [Pseudomonadales bacterium]
MNFFEAQDAARRRTWRLVVLFLAAVLTLVLLTNLLVAVAGFFFLTPSVALAEPQGSLRYVLESTPPSRWAFISLGVIGVVTCASLYKYATLRGGGRAVAESFNGRLLTREQADLKQQRLLNVVEEMAIASGTPVPPVYLLPEAGINAFAAGFNVDDAVIGVNQGTIDTLNRDELQGVIAHEFSHILNGDMRLNVRILAILHGILFLGLVGRVLLRHGGRSSGTNSRNAGLPVLVMGIGLLAIGYGGTFFGNLVKAAVGRQREYLADASAVQFTRNPQGIAGALKKIGGYLSGSDTSNDNAQEASHFFFAPVAARFARFLFATHPPLPERIRAIDPGWDGTYPEVLPLAAPAAAQDMADPLLAGMVAGTTPADVATRIVERVGNPDEETLTRARHFVDLANTSLTRAAHDGYSAVALMYALLLSAEPTVREHQLATLSSHAPRGTREEVLRLADLVALVNPVQKPVYLDRAIPALKTLSGPQYQNFRQLVGELVNADASVDLFEWVLSLSLMKYLTPHYIKPPSGRVKFRSLELLANDLVLLLVSLAAACSRATAQCDELVHAGLTAAGLPTPRTLPPAPDFDAVNLIVVRLRSLHPLQKPRVLKAAVTVLIDDTQLSDLDAGLLHAMAGVLDCPLPPLPGTDHA